MFVFVCSFMGVLLFSTEFHFYHITNLVFNELNNSLKYLYITLV